MSGNGDVRKVLATVIFTLNEFLIAKPDAIVFFTGSNTLRTRLYGRIIRQQYPNFSSQFLVEGVNEDGTTEEFDSQRHYSAFLISSKIL